MRQLHILYIIVMISVLCAGVAGAAAGDAEIASLYRELPARERADSLNSAASAGMEGDPDRALTILGESERISRDAGYRDGLVTALYLRGKLEYAAREYESAARWYREALDRIDGDETDRRITEMYRDYGHALGGAGQVEAARDAFHNSLRIHRARNDSLGIARDSRLLGLLHIRNSRYDSSLVYYSTARDYHRALGNMQRLGAMINSIGASYYQLGQYEKALINYHKALDIRRAVSDHEGVSRVLTNIGMLYNDMGNHAEAEKHFLEALEIAIETGNDAMIGYAQENLGETNEALGNYDTALGYYREGLACYRRVGERTNLIQALNALGELLVRTGRAEKAMGHLHEAQDVAEKISYRHGMAMSLKNIGMVHATAGRARNARDAYEQSMRISESTGNRELRSETLGLMADLFEADGDDGNALRYFKRHVALRDSIAGEQTARNIDRLRIVNQTELKERENQILKSRQKQHEALLRRKKIIILLISIVLVMTAGLSLVLFRLYAVKKKANDILSRNNRMITEQRDEIKRKNNELEDAIKHINTLSGLLPICSSCKKIRDDDGYWDEVDGYISRHSEAVFTHSICPDCMEKLYPEFNDGK